MTLLESVCLLLYGIGFFCYTGFVTTSQATKLLVASFRKPRRAWIYSALVVAGLLWPIASPVHVTVAILLQNRERRMREANADLPPEF